MQLAQLSPTGVVFRTFWVQNLAEITLYVLPFSRKTTFSICAKIQDSSQNLEKSKFFRGHRGVFLGIQGSNFAQNRSISYHFLEKQHFPFAPKFKIAAKIWKSQNFSEAIEEYSLVSRGPILPKIALSLTVLR